MTTEFWQWKHGPHYLSDLYTEESQALYWAERATTGGSDDDIAVRRVVANDWREVVSGGYADLVFINETGFEVGDIVLHTFHEEKAIGYVEAVSKYGLLVSLFGVATRYNWAPEQCTLLSRPEAAE